MATLRDIKRKIEAVKKTSQITKAMNMVAAAKLRGAQENMERFRNYAEKFREVIGRLVVGVEPDGSFLLMTPREEVKKIELVLLTADRGLCGSFNNNLIATAERFIMQKRREGLEVSLTAAGRKGRDYFRRRHYTVRRELTGLLNKPNYDDAFRLGREIIELFLDGDADEVYIIYSHFRSMVKQEPTIIRLLPVVPETHAEGEAREYIFEPSHEELLNDLLPNYVYNQLLDCFYLTAVSEHAARMTAMENATNNCKDMVHNLTLTYNKARQASITKELMDIVGGAEALKK
ncbi:ATP synthase F1 subunit gamma [Desulfosoma caldarium]|uniref:ATP synthase gamma chain n=1 Tax=Desulfosoma caldarium TaxID=610254 RepID=A0A3N1VL06_9BACT|nr:ATP synthase F1 subunit gamma [Desulfosoma caldarium]ROR03475.1 ATP synthase F1 subcomplex gamma subunit [Desulfosoma caldarium]